MGRKRENTVHDGRYMTTVHEVVVAAAGSFNKKELPIDKAGSDTSWTFCICVLNHSVIAYQKL